MTVSTPISPRAYLTVIDRNPGLAQTAARCRLRSRRDLYFQIFEIEITRNADTEPRVCSSPEPPYPESALLPLTSTPCRFGRRILRLTN